MAFVLSTLEPLERRVVRDDRSAHYIMRILPYREPDSTVSGVLITFVDVTSIVQAEEALVEADVRKDVFLATLSHELRNPLAPIRTAAQLLQSPELGPGRAPTRARHHRPQVGHMSSLLDDLLDVSRITRGAFLLKKEYVDVQVLMDDAVEAVQPAIDAKQHTLRVERPARADPFGSGSRADHPSHHQPADQCREIHARAAASSIWGRALRRSIWSIFVRDSGIGLTAEAMGKVFDMFTRIEPEVGRSEGGLGIGLALAKGLVELHGGRLVG